MNKNIPSGGKGIENETGSLPAYMQQRPFAIISACQDIIELLIHLYFFLP